MDHKPLPERQIEDARSTYRAIYRDLIGFVPPRIRLAPILLARVDPELLDAGADPQARDVSRLLRRQDRAAACSLACC